VDGWLEKHKSGGVVRHARAATGNTLERMKLRRGSAADREVRGTDPLSAKP
jgi:hypothetical protein